jgi:hypothetical protein
MARVILVHPHGGNEVSSVALLGNCTLFQNNPALLGAPYAVRSPTSPATFRQFVTALEGGDAEITNDNARELVLLCGEFGYEALYARVLAFHGQAAPEDRERNRVRDGEIAALNAVVGNLVERIAELVATVNGLRDGMALVRSLDSLILFDLPELLAEFRGRRMILLWRGSRDGFLARDFHRHCDNHANTLTVIMDTDRNIFGGFTPAKWEARTWNKLFDAQNNTYQADPARRSFLFTLRNPHNFPPKKFPLKASDTHRAIICDECTGPFFRDIVVTNSGNTNRTNYTRSFGMTYENDTGFNGPPKENTFFTGSPYFTVAEVEVFEIVN